MSEAYSKTIKIGHYDWAASRLEDIELGIPGVSGKNYDRLLSRIIVAEQANLRQGTSSVKTRGTVSRSTRKLYRQKGTGNARAGDAGSPTRYHGGVAFGPHPRSYNQKINKKEKKKAFLVGLTLRQNDIFCITGEFVFKKTDGNVLMLVDTEDNDKRIVFRNIEDVELINVNSVRVSSLMNYSNILVTEAALNRLKKRLHNEG